MDGLNPTDRAQSAYQQLRLNMRRSPEPCAQARAQLHAVRIDSGGISGSMESMSGPTQKYSITMPRDIAEAARARSGPSGLSAYVAAAVARQIERDNLNELIQVAEAEHGPVTDEEIQALRDQLQDARRQQAQDGVGAA